MMRCPICHGEDTERSDYTVIGLNDCWYCHDCSYEWRAGWYA